MWFNFRTGKYEELDESPSDDSWSDYIPQWPPVQNLFRLHLAMGKAPLEAMEQVLRVYLGERIVR